jgi:gluconokinase
MPVISPQDRAQPLVVALDIGTSSVRATLFDGQGRNVDGVQSRAPYKMNTTAGGGVEINADELIELAFRCLDELQARIALLPKAQSSDLQKITAVAVCTFWHGLLGVDRSFRAITPLYSWNDTRASSAARDLRLEINERNLHARTGCRLHASYWPAKLVWLRHTAPDLFNRVKRWMSIGEYLYLCLFGRTVASISMASATGLFNQNSCDWDEEILSHLNITVEHLSPIRDIDERFTSLAAEYSARWPQLAHAHWFPSLGDGACDNIGSGCTTQDRAALMIGTSGALRLLWQARSAIIPPELWCYRADRSRFVMGGALSNGGDVFAWMKNTLKLPASNDEIEASLAAMEADEHHLTMLPFLSGERSTGWNADARSSITGMSLDTTPLEILRAGLESVAYRFNAIYNLVAKMIGEPRELIASGAALLHSQTWAQIISDVIGREIIASAESEASSRGAALLALEELRAIEDLDGVDAARGRVYSPDPTRHARYGEGRERHERLYEKLLGSSQLPVGGLPPE